MAGLTYPPVLTPENWSKQKGVPPKSEVGTALTSLKKAHGNVDTGLLDTGKLKTAEDVQTRIDTIDEALNKTVKAASGAASDVSAAAKNFQKAKDSAKEAVTAAGAVLKAADAYAKDVVACFEAVMKELAPRLAKLEAEEAKNKKGEDEEEKEDPNLEKDRIKVGKMVETALKLAKTAGPTKPMKFVIGVLKKELYVFVAKATSGSTANRIKKLMEAGSQSMTFYRGDCLFENKAHVFVGVNIPTGGFAIRIQKALIEQTGKKYKIKVRKPTGETDEAAGDDDGDADDELKQATEQGGKDAAKANEVLARHKKLKPLFDGLVGAGGPLAAQVKAGLASFESSVKGKKFDEALKVLDDLEKSLRDKAKTAEAAKGSKADAEKSAKETADAAIDKAAKGSAQTNAGGASPKLASEWASARKDALDGIESLIKKIQDEYRDEADQKAAVAKAVADLRTLAGKLQAGLETQLNAVLTEADAGKRAALARNAKTTLGSIARLVVEDKLMAELDGNELMPELKVVGPMKSKLREIAQALG